MSKVTKSTDQAQIVILAGKINTYRIFDIGNEINLAKAVTILEKQGEVRPYHLRRTTRSFLIIERPVVLTLLPYEQNILGNIYSVSVQAKIWSFGSVSIQFSIQLNRAHGLAELVNISHFLEHDLTFHQEAVNRIEALANVLSPAIDRPQLWHLHEDYLIFQFQKAEGLGADLRQSFIGDLVSAMILGEKPTNFSENISSQMAKGMYQYSADDLVLLHWSGALIYDLEDADDISDAIEFALCQLLELRFYDSLLEEQLRNLYKSVELHKDNVFKDPYREICKKAALEYIDTSEIVDKVGNSLKIIGDFYYATIFRGATEMLRLDDWRHSVDVKLNHLADVSKLFQGDVSERRNQIMELTIILLITIDVIPIVSKMVQYLSRVING